MININKLSNGVTVITEEIDYVNSVAFGVWIKCGAVNETPDVSGVSHFIEHMMFKGTKTRSAKQIAEDMDKIGAQFNAFTGKEATCYYMKSISQNLEKGADIILDMVNYSVFDAHEMARERNVIIEEMKMTNDQPDELAQDKIYELLYKDEPLGKSIIGTPTSVKGISRNALLKYRNANYALDNIVVSVSGNFETEKVLKYLEDKFVNFEKKSTGLKNDCTYDSDNNQFRSITKEIQQSHIVLASKGLTKLDKGYYDLYILSNIVGGGMSSRFFQNIREEKGLAYSVYAASSSFSKTGMFEIYAGVAHENIRKAIMAIREELEKAEAFGFSEDELSMAKEQMKSSYIFGQENILSRMFANGRNYVQIGKVITADEVIDGIEAVSLNSIKEVMPLITDRSRYSGVIVSRTRAGIREMWNK